MKAKGGVSVRYAMRPGGGRAKAVALRKGATAADLLEKAGIHPDAVVVFRAGRPIPLDEKLEDGEEVEVVKVVSGG